MADEHGIMEFQFDLIWRKEPVADAQSLADSLVIEPVVLINPSLPEDVRLIRNLYRP